MNEQELITAFGKKIGLPELNITKEHGCAVTFDQDEVVFEVQEEHLFLIADLGPTAGHENLYTSMLEANHLGKSSGFGALGIDPDRESFTLTRVLIGPYNVNLFIEQVTLFVKNIRYWKKYLREN